MNLQNDVIKLLIKVLAFIIVLNGCFSFILQLRGGHESSALLGLAQTAVGGLIGLLVNPNTASGKDTKTYLAAAGDVNVSVPADVEDAQKAGLNDGSGDGSGRGGR